jgi:hypothetical protein
MKMDMSQYASIKSLKFSDLKESGPFRAAIVEVGVTEKFAKPELTLDDGSILSCNTTNTNKLIRTYGTESNDWLGKEIEIDIGEIDYQGQPQEAVLVKPISPPPTTKAAVKVPAKPRKHGGTGGDLDEEIGF